MNRTAQALSCTLQPSSALAGHRRRIAAFLLASALAPAGLVLPVPGPVPFGVTAVFAKENVSIDRIELPNENGRIVLSGITVAGSSLSRGDLEALLKMQSLSGLAERLDKLDADSLRIASIEWASKIGKQETNTVYEGIEATGIKAGVVEKVSIKGGRQNGKIANPEKTVPFETAIGKMTIAQIDMAGMTRWLGTSDATGKAPMKVLHGPYEMESMDMKLEEANIHIGKMTFSGMKARLAKQPPMDILALGANLDPAKKSSGTSPQDLLMLSYFLNVYPSFEFGEGAVDGVKISGKDKDGLALTATIGKVAFAGGASPYGALTDMDFKAQDNTGKQGNGAFKLKKLGFSGDFYAAIMLGLSEVAKQEAESGNKSPEAKKVAEGLRQSVAEAAKDLKLKDFKLELAGFDIDVPPSKDSKSKDRVKLAIASFTGELGRFVNLSPTRLDFALTNFTLPLPAKAPDPGTQMLKDMGIDTLDLTQKVKANWDEAKQRFMIEEISGDVAKLAKVTLKGELGGIPRALFENPVTNWPVVMMGGNVQNVSVQIENRGGLDKLIAKAAADQKKSPEQFKMEMSGFAPIVIAGAMGQHPDAGPLAEAVSKFIKTPGMLSVKAIANVPTGITVMDFSAASQNPSVLLQKVKIEASAK